jgi:hypothetical protein
MAQQKMSRSDALQYLAGAGFTFKKGHEYSDAYLKRVASSYKKQEAAGHKPSRDVARGHPKPRYVPHREIKGRPGVSEQYRLEGRQGHKPTKKQLEQFHAYIEKPHKQKKGEPEKHAVEYQKNQMTGEPMVTGNVTGIAGVGAGSDLTPGEEGTLSFRVTKVEYDELVQRTQGDLTLMGEALVPQGMWVEVYQIGILTGY